MAWVRRGFPFVDNGQSRWPDVAENKTRVTVLSVERFPCHGGIQKRDVMAKVTRKEHNYSVQLFYDVCDQ